MRFQANMAVRLRSNSELLFIDSIDEQSAVAYCRRYGDEGPVGTAEPYLLDSLRENVRRSSPRIEQTVAVPMMQRVRCMAGFHGWVEKTFPSRPILGAMAGHVCRRCGETRLADVAT